MSISDFTLDYILTIINIDTRIFGYNALCTTFQIFCIICVHFCIVVMVHLKPYHWMSFKKYNLRVCFTVFFFPFILLGTLCVFFKSNFFLVLEYFPYCLLPFLLSFSGTHIKYDLQPLSHKISLSLCRFLCNLALPFFFTICLVF